MRADADVTPLRGVALTAGTDGGTASSVLIEADSLLSFPPARELSAESPLVVGGAVASDPATVELAWPACLACRSLSRRACLAESGVAAAVALGVVTAAVGVEA